MTTTSTELGGSTRVSTRTWYRDLRLHRDLLRALVVREFKIRYKQSVMGFMWALLMPALIVGAGVVVRGVMARLSSSPLDLSDIAVVTAKSVPWAFFVSAVKAGSISLISNSNLVTKIYTPREVFPFASVGAQLIDFSVGVAVVALVLPFMGVTFSPTLFLIPILVAMLVVLVAALALFLSAASLFYRDVKYLVDVGVMYAIFFTPVFYESTMFGDWAGLILLNPVAPIIEGIGAAVAGTELVPVGWLIYSGTFATVGFVLALIAFKRMEPYFAESV